MEVKNRIMYHVHKVGIHDEIWKEENDFLVDENYNSYYCSVMNDFSTAVRCNDDSFQSFDRIINYNLKDEQFKNLDEEMVKRIFRECIRIIRTTNIYNRECALEKYRLDHYPDLPSRKHSLWLTNKKGLKHWEKIFLKKLKIEIYKVSVTGKLFKSSDNFLPDDELTVKEMYDDSERYWNPAFKTNKDEREAEYLFQGKVKIIEKIK